MEEPEPQGSPDTADTVLAGEAAGTAGMVPPFDESSKASGGVGSMPDNEVRVLLILLL